MPHLGKPEYKRYHTIISSVPLFFLYTLASKILNCIVHQLHHRPHYAQYPRQGYYETPEPSIRGTS
ncbi:hypothetical protein M430DRAFT_34103 [Amorphotheca resinae ATCC 22711]|uniref:Uncharacterized protein n=1 Tax=Amorphotheca resinae ATCC 22711 TaxID=857342 RepID=A0A2T3B5R9_AMORE|nr:hypothetical protein M430DRAFT_34103 [Amorphotheca resinae ATCC 22711]PSS22105.1 hypothetical protein M430DRAFT_34103 [Amorphotheca resinae ATCC 22711]